MAEGVWPLPFWSEDVYGPANYQSWLCWASIYATDSQLQSCDKLYSIGHRSEADGYGEPLPTSFPDGRRFIVQQRCSAANCERCRNGTGGWRWNWVGPWTPLGCLTGDKPCIDLLIERCSLPWPIGCLMGTCQDRSLMIWSHSELTQT